MNSHLISRGVGSAGTEASQRDRSGSSYPVSQHAEPQPDNRPKVETRPPREPTPPPGEDMVFEANELLNHLMPVWDRLYKSNYAMPFRAPVDPLLLEIPEYLDIVKRPMDLSTIFAKLDGGEYKNAWEFCDDMWLMFDNAWLYNKKNNRVYMCSTKLSELFVEVMNPVMKKMGYCCSQKLAFTPLDLFCYGSSMCTIARDQPYFCYETSSTQFNVTISDRYTYCQKCFDALPDEGISLSENPADRSNMVAKTEFKLLQNNQIDMEPFENCKYCKRKWHRICALHDKKVFPEGFICETCRTQKKIPKAENKFTAKKLAHCNLSTHLEDRVNTYIKQRTTQMNLKGDYDVVIRVLCAQEKEVEVKPLMKAKYCGEAGFPEKFPYKSKAVFAFEVIDGVEVCFFGLHVQEYGSSCGQPNQRQVYIASFDSVNFFEPRELRTDVYHEILLGYLDYAKKLGYSMAHIRACPPSEGNDYIFHCHPPEQKIPNPKRLQEWYKKMLEKGVEENCVVEFKDSYKQAKDDNLMTPIDVPYFEGDFLPNVIEDCIRDANNALKREVRDGDDDEDDVFAAEDYGWRNLFTMNKKNRGSSTGNEVADKLFSEFEKHKEVFFTVRLINQQAEMQMRNIEIKDPDGLLSSELMDCRFTFLTRARDEHWEFSSLRRAKFSTLSMCHALHDTDSSKVMNYTCNKCSSTSAKWHCTICEDFDLCDGCRLTKKHEHAMEPIKSLVDEYKDQAGGNNRIESMQRCIQSLVHACHCRDANCRKMSCHKMKRVVQHTKMCKKIQNSSCPVCKQLIGLCCYHAKHCNRDGCQVPFCINIRQKLSEQKKSMARRADIMMQNALQMAHNQMGIGQPEMGQPIGGPMSQQSYGQPGIMRFMRPQIPGGPGQMDSNGEFNNLPPREVSNQEKEWHQQVSKDLRNHLIGKIFKATNPSLDPAAIGDQRMQDLISYAKRVEKEMFEMADDREEYYHLLAEKIYKIQKELQERKSKRLNVLQPRQGGNEGAGGRSELQGSEINEWNHMAFANRQNSCEPGGNDSTNSIQCYVHTVLHARQCHDASCRGMSCHKMNRVVRHIMLCKKRQNGSCSICKQTIAICFYHANQCNRDGCQVRFCMNLRQKIVEKPDNIVSQRMAVLLHAQDCKKPVSTCIEPFCSSTKDLLLHIATCRNTLCNNPECDSSKLLLSHWKRCLDSECTKCKPLDCVNTTPIVQQAIEELNSLLEGDEDRENVSDWNEGPAAKKPRKSENGE